MSVKNVVLVALVLVNLLLVAALIIELAPVRTAQAQVPGGGYNYCVVTAKLLQGGGDDALWVLDLRTRKLSVFRLPQGDRRVMQLMDTRDVVRDLRGGEKSP